MKVAEMEEGKMGDSSHLDVSVAGSDVPELRPSLQKSRDEADADVPESFYWLDNNFVASKKPASMANNDTLEQMGGELVDDDLGANVQLVEGAEMYGVSVHFLQNHFLEEVYGAGHSLDSTVYDIEDLRGPPGMVRQRGLNVRCPIDGKLGAAYVHCLEGDHNVGPATHMLSYTWGYSIGDIVGTLVDFCKKEKLNFERTYFWICFLCVNQHRVVAQTSVVPTNEFLRTFGERVSSTGEILCMMAPWEKPIYLERIWCIFELAEAFSLPHCNVHVAIPPGEKLSLVKDLLIEIEDTDNSPVDVLYDALNSIRVEKAKASQEEDRRLILEILEQQKDGYQGTNNLVKDHLKEHVLGILQNVAKQCSVFDAHEKEELDHAIEAAVAELEAPPDADDEVMRPTRTLLSVEESQRLERKQRKLWIALGFVICLCVCLAVAWVVDSILRPAQQ